MTVPAYLPSPWKMYRGDPFGGVVRLQDQAPVGTKTWTAMVRPHPDSDRNWSFAIASAVEGADIVLTLSLTGVQTTEIPETSVFDLVETDGGSSSRTLLRGELLSTPDVTR